MGPDGADHVVCAQKLHRRFLLHNQFISSFLPWTFLSLTQGRKVGVIYWMHELGWIMCPQKFNFLTVTAPWAGARWNMFVAESSPRGPVKCHRSLCPTPIYVCDRWGHVVLSPEFIHKLINIFM